MLQNGRSVDNSCAQIDQCDGLWEQVECKVMN